jgi:hypothetical protein
MKMATECPGVETVVLMHDISQNPKSSSPSVDLYYMSVDIVVLAHPACITDYWYSHPGGLVEVLVRRSVDYVSKM